MKPLASLLFVAVIIIGVSSRCPQYWSFFEGKCYRYGDTAINYLEAQIICQTRGAKLTEVLSAEENHFLTTLAREKNDYCVWYGGDDMFKEGTWEWASTSNNFSAFTNWAIGQPDNAGGVEDCLNLSRGHNYVWNDSHCNIGCNFICSRPSNNINKTTNPCLVTSPHTTTEQH